MSHGIMANDKGIVARTSAWHNLFTVASDFMTASEAFLAAGLDWLVALVQPTVKNPVDGSDMVVDSLSLIQNQKTGEVYGAVTPGYAAIQNHTLRDAISAIFGETAKVIESAFSILGGRKVVMLVNMGAAKVSLALNGITVEDSHSTYLMFSTSHDGKGGWSILPTLVRVVCQNTVKAAEGEHGEILSRDGITIRHSSKASDRIADAIAAYQQAVAAGRLTLDRVQKVASVNLTPVAKRAYYRSAVDSVLAPVTDAQRKEAQAKVDAGTDLDAMKPLNAREEKREALYQNFLVWEAKEAATYTSCATETSNAYLVYNAVSDALEHESHFRKSDSASREENEFISRVYGKVSDQKEEALLLMEAVVAEPTNTLLLDAILDQPVRDASVPSDLLDQILSEA